ncbi:L,D-transpeptidase family protein [Agarivorans sp. 1_MG-2023]|uniref:L,D-transpeptidase family protein n=1 Tax=Agarivorans sp. 1_MG-2023 TaxID=3062634 RepID=UPI0026E2C34B|nr:L,D-transpeptidase family protein [Agarivorans sp. 1_MG-2023]MDO6763026.1 L,D-transpeptidase family protein [Agarivorans sp. 1_MG-2023]
MKRLLLACMALSLAFTASALTYDLPNDGSRLLGGNQWHRIQKGETIALIAERYGVGFLAVMAANKGVDPFLPEVDSQLLIPTQILLPDVEHTGVVVNLAELRLYYFRPNSHQVDVLPIGIGRIGRETPEMSTYISQKREKPTWTPTQNIRNEYAAKGIILPQVVQAGPENPLGEYALRLAYGNGEYLIHGTNKEFGVGLRVSSGCIRLFPSDIEYLFSQVNVKTPVRIIDQSIKHSLEPSGEYLLEVHQPLNRSQEDVSQATSLKLSRDDIKFITQAGVDSSVVNQALKNQQGIALTVGENQG